MSDKKNQELKAATSSAKANWAAVIVAIIFASASLALSIYQYVKQENLSHEAVTMSTSRVFDDYQALLLGNIPGGTNGSITGTISVYWSVIVSNIGDKDISIVKYDISSRIDYPIELIGSYSSMNQGVYSSFSPETIIDFPISIEAGHSVKFYIKTGIYMDHEAYRLSAEKFGTNTLVSINELVDYLDSNKIDFFGNEVFLSDIGIRIMYPGMKDQLFFISLVTARNTNITSLVSWYQYSGINN